MIYAQSNLRHIISRGGVEGTRLEAKDTGASVLQNKVFKTISHAKKVLKNFFSGELQKKKKKGLYKYFSGDLQKKSSYKKFFRRSKKFYRFKRHCCPRAEDRPIFEDLRPRGQGLKNVSSRTPLLVTITF